MIRLIFSTALTIVAGVVPLSAQEWTGNGTIYGWFPTITGAQEGRDGKPRVDIDSQDILDALDFAFFATGEFRRDRVGVFLDFAYVDLSADANAKPPFSAEATTGTKLYFASVAGAWRLQGDQDKFVDAYAGLRYYNVKLDFDLSVLGGRRDTSIKADASWFDPIVGMKGRYPLNDRWSLYGFADIGGFGIGGASELTWQAYSGLNFAFSDSIAGNFGYRYMSIDYDDELKLDVDIHGPVLGLTYRF